MTIVYFMTNQPFDAQRFFKFLSFAVLVGLIAQSMGIAIGAAFNLKVYTYVGSTIKYSIGKLLIT